MRLVMVWVFVGCGVGAAPALAQARPAQAKPRSVRPFVERGFITLNAGAQTAAPELTYRMGFEVNAEEGTVDARHPGRTGVLIDGEAGFRFRGRLGLALAASRATRSGDASVLAEIPHPFFDDRHRHVEGQAAGVSRTETAAHLQLYYDMQSRGAWRVRVFAGPSYFSAEQEIVTGVEAAEAFPFDTAEFRAATTSRAKGSGIGVHAGIDVTRMLTQRVGAGGLVRYARATLDLNAPGARRVSTEAGGVQAGAGLRVRF
jgi:hypothetical protein